MKEDYYNTIWDIIFTELRRDEIIFVVGKFVYGLNNNELLERFGFPSMDALKNYQYRIFCKLRSAIEAIELYAKGCLVKNQREGGAPVETPT